MATPTTLILDIPGLVDRPAVGTSCCVTTAEALIAQELWMLPGIADTEIDTRGGRVTISFDPEQVSDETIRTALGEVGYPPSPPAFFAGPADATQPQ